VETHRTVRPFVRSLVTRGSSNDGSAAAMSERCVRLCLCQVSIRTWGLRIARKKKRKFRQSMPRSLAAADRHRNEQTLHGSIRKYLRDANVDARDISGGVRVGDSTFMFTDEELSTPPLAPPVIDRLVRELLQAQLLEAVRMELTNRGSSLSVTWTGHEIHIEDPQRTVAVITATRAIVKGSHRVVLGNFLAGGGQHWEILDAKFINARRVEIAATKPGPVLLTVFPDALEGACRDAAFAASARIRLTRSRDFAIGTRVDVPESSCSVRFFPVVPESPVEVKFVYTRGTTVIRGALRLRTPQDPLALVLHTPVEDSSTIADIWNTVLRTYADLTCVPTVEAVTAETASSPPAGGRYQERSPRGNRDRAATELGKGTSRQPKHLALSESLQPARGTHELLASSVAGHRRVLRMGHRAGADARKRAEAIGITLGSFETWVRPHMRGVADDDELVFTWRG
jgi:hypothetical protein